MQRTGRLKLFVNAFNGVEIDHPEKTIKATPRKMDALLHAFDNAKAATDKTEGKAGEKEDQT